LGVVLAVFFLLAWLTRRTASQAQTLLPAEVVECLGRTPLAPRQQLQLVRVGHKLVLLSVTAGEARALTEVTDPDEVNRLHGLCRQQQPGSITASFRQVLNQSAREGTPVVVPESTTRRTSADLPRHRSRVSKRESFHE
jgi:flagellar biogenesis protein FliO